MTQDILISVVSLVAGAAISWFTSQHFSKRVQRPRLQVISHSTRLLSPQAPAQLKVTLGSIDVKDPHVVEVLIQNNGVVDLKADAFDSSRPLGIEFKEFKPVEVIDRGSGTPELTLKGAQVEVGPARLARGATWSLTLLGSGTPVGNPVLQSSHLADTDIFNPDSELARARKISITALILIALAFLLMLSGFTVGFLLRNASGRVRAIPSVMIFLSIAVVIVGTLLQTFSGKIRDRVRGSKLDPFIFPLSD